VILGGDVIASTFFAGGLIISQQVQEYGVNTETGIMAAFFAAGVAALKIIDTRLEKTRHERQIAMEESMKKKEERIAFLEQQVLASKNILIEQQQKTIDGLLRKIPQG
jgi:hypothetical protein